MVKFLVYQLTIADSQWVGFRRVRAWVELSMTWLEMTDVRAPCALRLRFILDTPIPLSLGYRLLVTGSKFHHRDTEDTEV